MGDESQLDRAAGRSPKLLFDLRLMTVPGQAVRTKVVRHFAGHQLRFDLAACAADTRFAICDQPVPVDRTGTLAFEAGQRQQAQQHARRIAARYRNEPFVDVMPAGSCPDTRSVRGSNVARIAVHRPSRNLAIVLVVEDNLVKGAAGQAVQAMNIAFGRPESEGLTQIALLP